MTAPTDRAPSLDFFARRFLATTAELNLARGRLAAVDALCDDAERGEGIVITPGFTTYYAVDAGLLRAALRGDKAANDIPPNVTPAATP